jgi:uncharacterized membrane protein HdeD (DUF308 family)
MEPTKPQMKQLTPLQNFLYRLGGILLLAGLLLWIPRLQFAPYVYTLGALLFGSMQVCQRYDGRRTTVRRLRRQQILGASLLVFTGVMMIASLFNVRYCTRNEWVVCLLIAAVFEIYTAFRLPAELSKEK